MTSHLSSCFPLTKSLSILRSPTPQKPIQVLNSTRRHRKIGSPDPPWLLVPPPAPVNPFSGETPPLFDFQLKSPATGIPFSLRLVQLRKKSMNSPRPRSSSPTLGSVGNAVWSLASIMEEIQRSILTEDDEAEETVECVSRDTGDSIVWLFRKVFCSSPNLAIGLLVLMSKFSLVSVGMEKPKVLAFVAEETKLDDAHGSKLGPPKIGGNYGRWSSIGILDGAEKTASDDWCPDYMRRHMAYENMIANEKTNSLILSNYAQLLYQYEKDFDRANHYFSWAVNAEPVDGEAMSRYAFFLWHGRGDLEGAEQMFLDAIQANPGNSYHRSNYAWFLWTTGAQDTCFPLEDSEEGDRQEL